MIGYYQSLAALRHGHAALRTGSFAALLTGDTTSSANDNTTYAFARSNDQETVIVVLNKGRVDNKPNVPVHDYFADGTILRDALTGKTVCVSGGRVELILPIGSRRIPPTRMSAQKRLF
jgi:hypothetical protein